MIVKNEGFNNLSDNNEIKIVEWELKYSTGIEIIDVQHRKLVDMVNHLYQVCLIRRDVSIEAVFKDIMSRLVEYVCFVFNVENEVLERIKFPNYDDHKREHEALVKDILEAAKSYDEGNKFAPNSFVRTLKDWVFGHIAISDRVYSSFFLQQKKEGLLSDKHF